MAQNERDNNALVFTFGVDINSIKEALDDATKDINQRIKEANRKIKDNDLVFNSRIATATTEKDTKAITDLIQQKRKANYESQKAILDALTKSYEALSEAEKKSALGDDLNRKILRQNITVQKALQSLNKLKETDTLTYIKDNVVNTLDIINPAAAKAVTSLNNIGKAAIDNFSILANKTKTLKGGAALSVGLVGGALYGFDSFVKSGIDQATTRANSYEQLSRAAERLNIAFSEYSKLSAMGKLAGVDIQPIIDRVNNLNLALSKAGEEGTKQTKLLENWGVSLRNTDGSYKSFSEQVQALVDGYNRANESGNGYAYSVEVLGNKLQDAMPLLRNYNKYLQEASAISKVGAFSEADAKVIADLKRLYEVQKAQTSGLVGQFSADVAKDYYERMIEINKQEAEFVAQNKKIGESLAKMAVAWESLKKDSYEIAESLMSTRASRDATAAGVGAAVGGAAGAFFGGVGAVPGAVIGASAFSSLMELFTGYSEHVRASTGATKKLADTTQESAEKSKQAIESVTDAIDENTRKKQENANTELTANIYYQTHSDEDNELYKLDEQISKYRDALADESLIQEYYANARAKIEEKYAKIAEEAKEKAIEEARKAQEEAQKEAEEQAKKQAEEEKKAQEEAQRAEEARTKAQKEIDSVFMTSYENRLKQIEEQKTAWINAGIEEVNATKAAEEQKRKARESEAEQYLRTQANLIKRASKLEKMGLSQEDIMTQLQQYQTKQQYKSLGLNINDIETGGKYMQAINNLVDTVKSTVLSPITQRLTTNNNATNTNNVTVNIDRPTVTDNNSINELAEKVAGRINEALEGGVSNAY